MEFAIVFSTLAPPIGFEIFLISLIISDIVSRCNEAKRENCLLSVCRLPVLKVLTKHMNRRRQMVHQANFFLNV